MATWLPSPGQLDEYEYDDDEEDEKLSKEEDPRVIKELIDLIKKAGGIEELEKQLKLSKEGSTSQTNQLTTQSPISKSLYERVLSKTLKNTPPSRKNSYVSLRNSRGPQSEGLSTVEKTSTRSETPRGKLSYTTISRNRPAASKTTEDEDEDGSDEDDDEGKSRNTTEKSRIEYVDIRRNRNRGSTTAKPEDKKVFNRNQILGEDDETNDESDDETDDEEEETDNTNSSKKTVYTPQYVNIRRSRPSTTEEPETSKYVQLRRGTTESTVAATESSSDRTTSKYKFIRRGSTSTEEPDEESSTARYQTTSSASAATSDDNISTKKYLNFRRGPTTELFSSVSDNTNSSFSSEMPTSKVTETTTPTPRTTEELGSTSQTSTTLTSDTQQEIKKETFNNIPTLLESISSVKDNLNTNETENSTYNIENTTDTSSSVISQDTSGDVSQPIKRPQLFNPRPFSKSTRGTTTPKPTIEPSTSKVSQSNLKYRLKIDNSEPEETKLYKTRGSSRFNSNIPTRQEDKLPDYFPQKRRISTTEKYVEENRSYRPSELADLSSLTAADFSRVSDLDLARATNRRRRPTVTSTISEEASEINTTPSTRKLDSVSSFGRRRKLIRGKPDPTKTEDENTSTTKRIRGFSSRSTREPSTTESIFSSSAAFNLLSRNRKVIRRLKTSTPIPSSTHKVEDDLNDDSDFQENRVEDENDDEDPVIEEEENIKLSESNIRENSAINSFGPDPKLRRKLVGSGKSYLPEKPVTDQQLSTSSYNVEMSDVDEFSSVKKSTEPNIVVRTRKIVRKLIPTEPTIKAEEEFESEQSFGRKRKIIRKLRPISQFNRIEDNKETVKLVTTYKHTDEPLEITTVDNISSHEDVTTPDEVDDATAGSKENKSTNVSEPSSEKTLNLPKTLPQPEITGESDSSSKKSIELKNIFTPEPTENSELSTEKPLVGSKRLFRPKLYNSRNKSDSKLNSSEGISKNSEIIRITNSSGTDNSRRVASRGRNKIFRPKIIEARNRFKDDKETLSTEKRLPNTQRLSLYSRRPNILKSTDDENSSTENVISSSSASDEELNDYSDKYDHNSNDHPENHDSVSTTEFISSKYTELNFKKYNRYRRPNEQPNSIRTKSTTIIETEENSPNENRITSPEVVSSTPVYTDIKMTSQEIDDPDTNNELSTSEYAEVEDITTEYSSIMNTTEYEVPNVTETYTIEILSTEFVTIASDSETYITPEIDTERDEEIRINETTLESNKASTSASLYEITTSGAIVTNDIDSTFVNETFSDSIGPTTLKDGFETPEVSTENSDQTYFETTIIPDTTTEDILSSEKIVGDIPSSSTIGSTTQQHRTITLRPIGARPKFVPPRLKDLSIGHTTESVAKPSKAYGGNRLKLTTADDSSINDSSDTDTVPERNTESRSKLSPKYSTTERNRFNKYKKGYNSGLRTTANIQNPKVTEGNRVESSSKSINTFLYKYSTTENSNSESDDGDEEESNIQEPTEDSLLGNKYKKGYNSALRTTENVKNPEVTEDRDIESSSAKSINIFLYKYSTTENLNSEFDDGDDEVEEEISIQEPTEDSILVNKYKKGYNSALRTTDNVKNPEVTEDSHFGRSSTKSINRFLYKYSTTENLNSESDDDDDEESNVQDPSGDRDEEIIEGVEETIPQVSDSAPKSRKPNTPAFAKKNTIRLSNKPFFSKPSTENSKIEESLKDIDTEAIKNRNKSLFSKNRMMNAPLSVQSTTNLPTTDIEETTSSSNDIDSQYSTIEYSTTSTKLIETTEDLTTLHHIFAESTDGVRSTTDAMNDKTETTTSKVERLIEVNRIIKVETKEEHDKNHIIEMNSEEVSPIQNKVGEVNRVTVIKVVDTDDHMKNKNEGMIPISPVYIQKNTTSTESAIKSSVDMIIQIAKVQEIPATDILERVNLTNISVSLNTSGIPLPPQREGRKFEIFGVGGSKIADNKNVNQFIGKADIIYGISNINVVTPRSAHNTESSTISLEGLFRTEGSTLFSKTPTINDELLETDHSKFVNVRVLHPDESMRVNKEHTKSGKVIPIKILKQDDDEYAMKADVIEVPAKPNLETIKIAPIKVEMSKSIASNLPLIRFSSKSLPTV